MNKKFLIYQFKKWLPIFGVFLGVLLLAMIASVTNAAKYIFTNNIYQATFESDISNYIKSQSPLFSLIVTSMIFTLILPLAIFDYRYRRSKADLYLQLPFESNSLRIHRIIIASIMMIACLFIAYILGMGLLAILQAVNNPYTYSIYDPTTSTAIKQETVFYFNYGHIFLTLIISIPFIIIELLINSVFAFKANNYLDSLIYISIGFTIRLLIIFAIALYFYQLVFYYNGESVDGSGVTTAFLYINVSMVTPLVFIFRMLSPLISNKTPVILEGFEICGYACSLVIYLALGILSLVYLYYTKEKFGENVGRKRNNTMFDFLLPHISMLISAFFIGFPILQTYDELVTGIIVTLSFALVYYINLALLSRSFKISKKDLIAAGTVMAILIILCSVGIGAMNYYDSLRHHA